MSSEAKRNVHWHAKGRDEKKSNILKKSVGFSEDKKEYWCTTQHENRGVHISIRGSVYMDSRRKCVHLLCFKLVFLPTYTTRSF